MDSQNNNSRLPLIPLRDIVVFPNMVAPLFVGRDKSVKALENAMNADKNIILVTQKKPSIDEPQSDDIYEIGTLGKILQLLRLPDGTVKALIEGGKRVAIKDFKINDEYIEASYKVLSDEEKIDDIDQVRGGLHGVLVGEIISLNKQLKDVYRGSFKLKKLKGKYYWYYQLSARVKSREKYLCSVEPNDLEPNQTSFTHAVIILQEKLRSKFVMGIRNKSYLHTYIIPFKEYIDNDKNLTSSVIAGRRNTIDRFGSWCKNEGIRLNVVPTNDIKIVYGNYIKFLENKGLVRSLRGLGALGAGTLDSPTRIPL